MLDALLSQALIINPLMARRAWVYCTDDKRERGTRPIHTEGLVHHGLELLSPVTVGRTGDDIFNANLIHYWFIMLRMIFEKMPRS